MMTFGRGTPRRADKLSALAGKASLAALLMCTTSSGAIAACNLSFLCSGTETSAVVVGSNVTPSVAVNTDGTFSVNTPTGTALSIFGMGAVSYVDMSNSPLTSGNDKGLFVEASSDGGGDSSVLVSTGGSITAVNDGVHVVSLGAGSIDVTVGDVTTTAGPGLGYGVRVQGNSDTTGVDISTGTVSGGYHGIYVNDYNTGSAYTGAGLISITSTGDVTGLTGNGIVSNVNGPGSGVSINVSGDVTGGVSNGIYSTVAGSGTSTIGIQVGGIVEGADNGIFTTLGVMGTDLSIDVGGAVGGAARGIYAVNLGTGATTVSSSGLVQGVTGYDGASVEHNGAGLLSVNLTDVEGGLYGLILNNKGTGSVDLDITGEARSLDLGSSAVRVIGAAGSGGMDIDINEATGQLYGVIVENSGTGDTLLTTTGLVSGQQVDGYGIRIIHQAAGKARLEAGSVSGGYIGVLVQNSGTGNTEIVGTGLIEASAGNGVHVLGSADVDIDVQDVRADNSTDNSVAIVLGSSGEANVTVRGEVYADGAAIFATGTTLADVTVMDGATVRNTTGLGDSLAVGVLSGALKLTNNGVIVGRVTSAGGDDVFSNAGTWTVGDRMTAYAFDGGAGTDQLTNLAAGRIVTAVDGPLSELTTFSNLESFINQGTIVLSDGGADDLLHIAGDAAFTSGSNIALDINKAGSSDLIEVAGLASIEAGAKVTISSLDGVLLDHKYRVLSATGGVSGTFGPVVSAFLGMESITEGNDAFIRLNQSRAFGQAARTRNQLAVAGAIPEGGALSGALLLLPDDQAAQAAFDSVSGEIHASGKTSLVQASQALGNVIGGRLAGLFDAATVSATPVLAGDQSEPSVIAPTEASNGWGTVYGALGEVGSDGNAASLATGTGGIVAGADGMLGDWRLGMLAGYSRSSFSVDGRSSSGSSENFSTGLYGGSVWGNISFKTGLAYTWHHVDTSRVAAFPGVSNLLTAAYDAGSLQGFGEIGVRHELSDTTGAEVFGNVAYTRLVTGAYNEQGGAAALSGAESAFDATFTTLGLRVAHQLSLGELPGTLRGMVGWQHRLGDAGPTASHALAGGNSFTVEGAGSARDTLQIEAGLDIGLAQGAALSFSYTGSFAEGSFQNGLKADLSVRF